MSRRSVRPVSGSCRCAALSLALALALASVTLPAQAQTPLADPTRPPPEARLSALGAGADAGAAPVPSGPRLQSVLNGNHGRQVAVIDGQTLRVGDKLNGATLVQIGRDQVVLQHGRARRVLKLNPDAAASDVTRPASPRTRVPNTAPEN